MPTVRQFQQDSHVVARLAGKACRLTFDLNVAIPERQSGGSGIAIVLVPLLLLVLLVTVAVAMMAVFAN
jgi:hypothetical protein